MIKMSGSPSQPKVTIAIPTLSREACLRISLDSALRQTYVNVEIIVSDNASTDGTSDFLSSLEVANVIVLRQSTKLTMVENWNACLRAASGEYFLLLSDDDVLEPTAVEEMVSAFRQDREHAAKIGLVYCRGRVIDKDGEAIRIGHQAPRVERAERLILGFFDGQRDLWPCAILYRREDIESYSSKFSLGADAAVWISNAAKYGGARFVDKILTNYRVHQSLTLQSSYQTWARENIDLARYAIGQMEVHRGANAQWATAVVRAQWKLNVRLLSGFINSSSKDEKLKALVAYLKNAGGFCSIYGLRVLVKGIALLLLPRRVTQRVVALKRSIGHRWNVAETTEIEKL